MKAKIQIPQEILTAIDYANTTNGGMSEPYLSITQDEKGYEVRIKAAGLGPDSFQVDVLNNRLWVYHLLPLFADRPDGMANLQTARTLCNFFLPNDVNVDKIVAHYEQSTSELNVSLPYNHPTRNFRRHIDVEIE